MSFNYLIFILDKSSQKWRQHKAVVRLSKYINLENTCGYITFVNTKVPDIGCEEFSLDVRLEKPKSRRKLSATSVGKVNETRTIAPNTLNLASAQSKAATPVSVIPSPAISEASIANIPSLLVPPITDLLSPLDASEITTFNQKHQSSSADTLKTFDDFVAVTPLNIKSPANDYRSEDCNELILKELEILENKENARKALVSQSSVEVLPIKEETDEHENEYFGEVSSIVTFVSHYFSKCFTSTFI